MPFWGNTGYESLATEYYQAQINARNPDEYWCDSSVPNDHGESTFIWFEGKVVPFLPKFFTYGAYLVDIQSLIIPLEYGLASGANTYQPFPDGEYFFFSFAVDLSSGAIKGDFKNVKTCSLP
jgi:hypothetical protein